jgi:hypothetical protein
VPQQPEAQRAGGDPLEQRAPGLAQELHQGVDQGLLVGQGIAEAVALDELAGLGQRQMSLERMLSAPKTISAS